MSCLLRLYSGASANSVNASVAKNLEKCQIFHSFWVSNKLLSLKCFFFYSSKFILEGLPVLTKCATLY